MGVVWGVRIMAHYYELTGESRRNVMGVLHDRKELHDAIMSWTEGHGATSYVHASSRVVGVVFRDGADVSERCWRKHYDKSTRSHDDWHVPNRSTKDGKAISREMQRFHIPGAVDIATALGLDVFYGNMNYTVPGVRVWGPRKRVILVVSEHIPAPTSPDCTRISDVRFEELEKRYEGSNRRKTS